MHEWLFWYGFGLFMCSLIPLFFWVVEPSLLGKNDLRIGADSAVYLWDAGLDTDAALLRNYYIEDVDSAGFTRELDWTRMFTFASNALGPVTIAVMMGSNFRIMLFNYVLFFISVYLLCKGKDIRPKLLVTLLLINPITLVSILTLNKEIILLLSVALFSYYLEATRFRFVLFLMLLVVSFFTRWEQAVFVAFLILLSSPLNPFRRHRLATIVVIVASISIIYPQIRSMMAEWQNGGRVMGMLNSLQDHYLFFVAVLPKAFLNIAPTLLAISDYKNLDWHDVQNSLILLWHGALTLIVIFAIMITGRFKLRSNAVYYALLFALVFSASPIVQPRYLYPVYIFACVELATRRNGELSTDVLRPANRSLAQAAPA